MKIKSKQVIIREDIGICREFKSNKPWQPIICKFLMNDIGVTIQSLNHTTLRKTKIPPALRK